MPLDTKGTLTNVPNHYREWLVGLGLSEMTIRAYCLRLRQAMELLGEVHLDDAEPSHIRAVSEALPRTSGTQRQLRSALKHYYEMTDRHRPPIRAVRVPPEAQPKNKALDPHEAHLLAKTARSWFPEGTAVMLGLYMALRSNEIATFKLTRLTSDGEWYTVTGKGDRTHTLPVHPLLMEEIAAVRRFIRGEYLFVGARGRSHVASNTIYNWTRRVSNEAGIGDVHPHQLRHTALTTSHDETGDIRAVSRFARHSSISMTERYTRTTGDQLKRAMLAIDYG